MFPNDKQYCRHRLDLTNTNSRVQLVNGGLEVDDIVEMDEPLDLLADADAVVPVCKLKSDANVAKYAAEFVKREPATSNWPGDQHVRRRRCPSGMNPHEDYY